MGLCKCPKKKVTTQFCFEHRVNVCEHCLVSSHPKVSAMKNAYLNHVKPVFTLVINAKWELNDMHLYELT